MAKDWTGNSNSIYKTIGATGHSKHERQSEDYYATEPKATELLCDIEQFGEDILEPSCGEGHMSKILEDHGYNVTSLDLVDRGYGQVRDFFTVGSWHGDIVTNPPYKIARQFVEHALDIIPDGRKVAMFLKLTFLEGTGRREMFKKYPPKRIWVSSSRLLCAMNGKFDAYPGSATAYGWFVWEKGFKGDPIVKWFN